MIISANNNRLFGGTLINQKYSPLEQITISNDDRTDYVALFNQRITSLSNINAFPKKLSLIATWPVAFTLGTAPMVVISSGRAEWLKTLFDQAATKGAVTGYNDASSFSEGFTPWFAPRRSGRVLYIVVHSSEYGYYKQKLGNNQYANVYVVGWRFPYAQGKFGIGPTGFGASRFAALELVKNIGYDMAWAVDDNVVNINGFPNTLATIEANMTNQMWGIGFSAATANSTDGEIYTDATFTTTNFNFGNQSAGLLQQVVLWNVALLRNNTTNMSPYFVASNEDVSFSNYLQINNYTERVIKALSIIKGEPTKDTKNKGANVLAEYRQNTLKLLYQTEKDIQIKSGNDPTVTIAAFVKDTILPKSQNKGGSTLVTQSQAIEQVLAACAAKNWAPTKIFNPYSGFQGTTVERLAG